MSLPNLGRLSLTDRRKPAYCPPVGSAMWHNLGTVFMSKDSGNPLRVMDQDDNVCVICLNKLEDDEGMYETTEDGSTVYVGPAVRLEADEGMYETNEDGSKGLYLGPPVRVCAVRVIEADGNERLATEDDFLDQPVQPAMFARPPAEGRRMRQRTTAPTAAKRRADRPDARDVPTAKRFTGGHVVHWACMWKNTQRSGQAVVKCPVCMEPSTFDPDVLPPGGVPADANLPMASRSEHAIEYAVSMKIDELSRARGGAGRRFLERSQDVKITFVINLLKNPSLEPLRYYFRKPDPTLLVQRRFAYDEEIAFSRSTYILEAMRNDSSASLVQRVLYAVRQSPEFADFEQYLGLQLSLLNLLRDVGARHLAAACERDMFDEYSHVFFSGGYYPDDGELVLNWHFDNLPPDFFFEMAETFQQDRRPFRVVEQNFKAILDLLIRDDLTRQQLKPNDLTQTLYENLVFDPDDDTLNEAIECVKTYELEFEPGQQNFVSEIAFDRPHPPWPIEDDNPTVARMLGRWWAGR